MKQGHSFSQVPKAQIQRSSFDRSHGVITTFDSGYLIPIFTDEILPGDTFNLKTSGFARLATPLYPVMDTMYLDTFSFFVPLRLIFDNFAKMMGEQENPGDSVDYTTPKCAPPSGGYAENTLQDYLGLPTKSEDYQHTTMLTRAYNLIYNQWFRDENLQDSVVVDKGDTDDDPADYVLLRRGKRHDYFTSCLIAPQKAPDVTISLGTTAPIIGDITHNTTGVNYRVDGNIETAHIMNVSGSLVNGPDSGSHSAGDVVSWNYGTSHSNTLTADLANATSSTINQLREAIAIQQLFEVDARAGTRLTEIIKGHFGVTSPDARLQRAEYLGGGSTPINITPIAQTAPDASDGSVGALGAMGTTSFSNHGFTKSFTEHGIVITLASVRADLHYQQGVNKQFLRTDKLSYFWPKLANIGEQSVLNSEIYVYGGDPLATFGYQERYAEYRYKPSTVHGQFRSNCTAPLDAWHLAQNFSTLPSLGPAFIEENPPIDRVVVVTSEPQFIADFHHKLICARPMPMFGVPGLERF